MSILSFEVDGGLALKKVLENLESTLEDQQPILDEAGALLLNRIRTRFLSQVDPNGDPWIPSKAALLRAKLNVGGGTLYNTGNLFHSIQLYSIDPHSRAIGTDVYYAGYLNDGTSRLPAREFMGLSQEDVDIAESLIIKRIEQALEDV